MGDEPSTIHLTRTRVLLGALAIVLLAGGTSYAAAQAGSEGSIPPYRSVFSDVRQADADLVDTTAGAGCMSGFPNGTFRPNRSVKRLHLTRGLNACAARVGYFEGTEDLSADFAQRLTFVTAHTASPTPNTGGWITMTAAIEVSTTQAPATQCTVVVRLVEGNSVLEELYLDLLPDGPRPARRANGTIVEGDELHRDAEPFSGSIQTYEVTAQLQPGCSVPVRGEAALSTLYAPFDQRGAPSGWPIVP